MTVQCLWIALLSFVVSGVMNVVVFFGRPLEEAAAAASFAALSFYVLVVSVCFSNSTKPASFFFGGTLKDTLVTTTFFVFFIAFVVFSVSLLTDFLTPSVFAAILFVAVVVVALLALAARKTFGTPMLRGIPPYLLLPVSVWAVAIFLYLEMDVHALIMWLGVTILMSAAAWMQERWNIFAEIRKTSKDVSKECDA